MKKIKLISDQAIGEADKSKKDGLGFDAYAEILSGVALGTTGPFTVGVFGEWGSGKTSLLKMIEEKLKKEQYVLTVWFNAWKYEQEDHPIIPLVVTIVNELEKFQSGSAELKGQVKSLLKALKSIAYGFSAKSKIKMPGIAELEVGLNAKDIIDKFEKSFSASFSIESIYHEAYEILNKIDFPEEFKIVVIIDDLDRCLPSKAVKLLESIKLVLSQSGFIFYLGVARTVVEGYLKHRYEKEFGIIDFEGQEYLDKMVQLPFHIPPHDDRMEDFTNKLIKQFDNDINNDELKDILPIMGYACNNNPRTTIRFLNSLIIDLEIFSKNSLKESFSEDIKPLGIFAITRSLQLRWKSIYEQLMDSDDLCNMLIDWSEEKIPDNVENLDDVNISNLGKLFLKDKNLQKLMFSSIGVQWLLNKNERNVASQFIQSQTVVEVVKKSKNVKVFVTHPFNARDEASNMMSVFYMAGVETRSFVQTNNKVNQNNPEKSETKELIPNPAWNSKDEMMKCDGCVILITEKFMESEGCKIDVSNALEVYKERENFHIYTVLTGNSSTDDMPNQLIGFKIYDFRNPTNLIEDYQYLILDIQKPFR